MMSLTRTALRTALRTASLAAAGLLAACQTYSPEHFVPGTPLAQVEAAVGPRTAAYPQPDGGQRVEYARGPFGRHTFMVDVDAAGRVTGVEQVLTEANFARIATGHTRDQVLRVIGHPSNVGFIGYQQRALWSYRYDAIFCTWYQVSFDATDTVVDTGYGPDPLCDRDERDL